MEITLEVPEETLHLNLNWSDENNVPHQEQIEIKLNRDGELYTLDILINEYPVVIIRNTRL